MTKKKDMEEQPRGNGQPADLDMLKRLMAIGLTESEIRRFVTGRGWTMDGNEYEAAKRDVRDAAEEDLRPFLILANRELYRKHMDAKDLRGAQRVLKALALLNSE